MKSYLLVFMLGIAADELVRKYRAYLVAKKNEALAAAQVEAEKLAAEAKAKL